ncbi:MAG TPA: CBS domain-containing protein [Planctomycetaceae bacterium]|nr:CBS domain-containing protein [Planctomycetaceae bacterium]
MKKKAKKKRTARGLTAADIMQRKVVVVGPSDTLEEAMALMTEHHVSGLPVLNARDKCIGVISATDIMNFEQEQSEWGIDGDDLSAFFDPQTHRWEMIRVRSGGEDLPDVCVREVMSRELVSVKPTTPVKTVAQKMLDEDIHRVLVMDDNQYLHGIISAMDFVRLYAGQ